MDADALHDLFHELEVRSIGPDQDFSREEWLDIIRTEIRITEPAVDFEMGFTALLVETLYNRVLAARQPKLGQDEGS